VQTASAAQSGTDQAGHELGVVQAGRRPHAREHRRGGEARHRVDLVQVDVEIGRDEEVHAGEAGAVQRGERRARVLLDPGGHVGGQPRRHVELGGVVEVLGFEVVELVAGDNPDLGEDARLGRPAVLAFQHAALDLAAGHGRLDEHLRVHGAGRRDRRVEVGPRVDLGNPERGAAPGRLDEGGQAEAPLVGLGQGLAGAQHRVRADGYALGGGELLGELLVHGRRGAKDVGPHVRDPSHL
jgi:hypothetical protein